MHAHMYTHIYKQTFIQTFIHTFIHTLLYTDSDEKTMTEKGRLHQLVKGCSTKSVDTPSMMKGRCTSVLAPPKRPSQSRPTLLKIWQARRLTWQVIAAEYGLVQLAYSDNRSMKTDLTSYCSRVWAGAAGLLKIWQAWRLTWQVIAAKYGLV